jgi:dinuclear metal center YbgI/SA1388 family protein
MTATVPLADIVGYLDQYLRIREVPDETNAVNGLQAMNASGLVGRIIAGVDASLATIAAAGGREAGTTGALPQPTLLLVHHGLFWDGNVPLTGRRHQKVRALFDNDIALYSAHIPLDVHAEVGNNHVLARMLQLRDVQPFDLYRGISIGVQGTLDPAVPREALATNLGTLVGGSPRLIPGGPSTSRRVGIISGGAGDRIRAAAEAGLDTFVTGEGAHHTYFDATELGVNAIYAGHYATETVGVKALAEHLSAQFGIPWEFHDHPTGL